MDLVKSVSIVGLGENVVEPVVKLNGYLAGLYRMLELMGVKKK